MYLQIIKYGTNQPDIDKQIGGVASVSVLAYSDFLFCVLSSLNRGIGSTFRGPLSFFLNRFTRE